MKKIIRYFSLLIGFTASFTSLAREKISLVLDWYVNPDHAAIIVAQQKSFFEKNNLDVEIIEPADPSLPPKLSTSTLSTSCRRITFSACRLSDFQSIK